MKAGETGVKGNTGDIADRPAVKPLLLSHKIMIVNCWSVMKRAAIRDIPVIGQRMHAPDEGTYRDGMME